MLTKKKVAIKMVINEFDHVLLKTGDKAYIADVLKPSAAYVADIDRSDGSTDTEIIEQKDIQEIIE